VVHPTPPPPLTPASRGFQTRESRFPDPRVSVSEPASRAFGERESRVPGARVSLSRPASLAFKTPEPRLHARHALRLLASAASLGLAAWLLIALIPTIGGVGWTAIGDQLARVGPAALLGLTALWLTGLWTYTYVLTGSMPGLRHSQAFALNAAGSAISNVLPFGGAAGIAVTAAMASSWGHSARAITTSAIVTGVWNAGARVALPLAALAVHGAAIDRDVLLITATATAAFAATLLALTRLRWLGRLLGGRAARFLLRLRRETRTVIRTGWRTMTLGMAAYLTLQALLLWCCLAVTGVHLAPGPAVAAFAVSRLLTLAVVTPGGFGVSENGTIALLIALGTPAAPAVAGVLLFAGFTYLAEIPMGGLAWLTWSVRRARSS
jgi:putative heme transporter